MQMVSPFEATDETVPFLNPRYSVMCVLPVKPMCYAYAVYLFPFVTKLYFELALNINKPAGCSYLVVHC